ncbi:MAG: 50S ribosomal protein L1 [Candidatus Nanoarchaeia archaeon]|nr:50S ribosomal protein L1 [Candidatus Nanoarchaeia archaeon]
MDKKQILTAIEKIRKDSPKRGFNQTLDFILNLKGLDLKNPSHKVDIFIPLPNLRSRKTEICAIVDDSILAEAKKTCDMVIPLENLAAEAKKKRAMKKLARKIDFFITQPHLMKELAANLGKILGTKGKMPNPKSGAVVPPKAPLQPVVDKLRKTVRLATKNDAIIKCAIGDEKMADEQIADNIMVVYNAVVNALPQKENNIKTLILKLTMGAPVKVGEQK